MRGRGVRLAFALSVAALLACSGRARFDADQPKRPLFQEVEGLRWGMTSEEVKAVWGPDREGKAYHYDKKGGYPSSSLGYMSIPPDMIVHKDARLPAGGGPAEFLIYVSFDGDATVTKEKVRADLVSRFGQPLADAVVLRAHDCEGPCELWRAAEMTLVKARWNPANAELNWPEHLSALTWDLAPAGLVTWVPRSEWAKIRGAVPLTFAAEARAKIEGFRMGIEGASVAEITKALGPPNLQLEEKPGETSLAYLFLDDAVQKLRLAGGKLQGVSGQSRN